LEKAMGENVSVDGSAGLEALDQMERILHEETIGFVGMSRDGEPYVVPVNYVYSRGSVLFHCGPAGKKIDFLTANPAVCFVVGRQTGDVRGHAGGAACHLDNDSIICYGTARVLDHVSERAAALNVFNRCFDPDAEEISQKRAENCTVVEISVSEMTGRTERERKHTHWRHVFSR
jgi:uncharacterized protein